MNGSHILAAVRRTRRGLRFIILGTALSMLVMTVLPCADASAARYRTYVSCKEGRHAREASTCYVGDHVNVFFRASGEVEYEVCIRAGSADPICKGSQHALPGTLYENRIYAHRPATIDVTWKVDEAVVGASTVRILRRQVSLPTQGTPELQVEPQLIGFTGDGTGYLGEAPAGSGHRGGGLHWHHWGRRWAFATGALWVNTCRPDCAYGHFFQVHATVRVYRPRHWIFTRMTIKDKLHGHAYVDHRKLMKVGRYLVWAICGSRYTSHC